MTNAGGSFVFIGNWDRHKRPGGTGFGVYRFNADTGALALVRQVLDGITVGAAHLDARRGVLYCVDEYDILPGYFRGGGGQVFAFAVDPESAALNEINHRPSFGSLPSYVAVDGTGRFLVVTHHTDREAVTKIQQDEAGAYRIVLTYDDATTVLFPLAEDGAIAEPCHIHTHTGDGGPLPRQTHPQLHSVSVSPSGEFLAVCDKSDDEIVFFRIDAATRTLQLAGDKGCKTIPGSSPRYSVFHPTRPFLFVNYETKGVVQSFRYDADGRLTPVSTIDALPDGIADRFEMKQSDIALHPSGKHLYSLVRGISTVAVFAVDEASGALEKVDDVTLDGVGPRGCAISPDGRFMIIACHDSKEVLVWAIAEDGTLSSTGCKVSQPNPGTVTFF